MKKKFKFKMKRYWIPIGMSLAVISVFFIFQNGTCNQASSTDNSSLNSNALTTGTPNTTTQAGSVNLFPLANSVVVGGTVQFKATGGTQPYSFFVITGGGTIDMYTGIYTATTTTGNVEVEVQDANGNTNYALVAVVGSAVPTPTPVPGTGITLTVTATSTKMLPSKSVNLFASGGTAPYTFTLLSGGGSISRTYFGGSSYIYNSPTYSGTAVVQASDALGNTGRLSIATIDLPTAVVNNASVLWIDQYFAVTYSNPAGSAYPVITVFGTSPSYAASWNCVGGASLPCVQNVTLSNFQNTNVLQTSYRGIISVSGRGGSASMSFCINPNDTTKAVISGTNVTVSQKQFLAVNGGTLLFNGAKANTGLVNIDGPGGAGSYSVSVVGQYSGTYSDCADLGTTTIQVLPW